MTATRKLKKKKAEKKLKLCRNNALQNLIRNTFSLSFFPRNFINKEPLFSEIPNNPFLFLLFFLCSFRFLGFPSSSLYLIASLRFVENPKFPLLLSLSLRSLLLAVTTVSRPISTSSKLPVPLFFFFYFQKLTVRSAILRELSSKKI